MHNIPSQRIRFALEALERAEQPDAPVKPNMAHFHTKVDDQCFACLGGLAAIEEFGLKPLTCGRFTHEIRSSGWEKNTNIIEDYEESLDYLRVGMIEKGLGTMGLKKPDEMESHVLIADYRRNPAKFKSDMHRLADQLEGFGL